MQNEIGMMGLVHLHFYMFIDADNGKCIRIIKGHFSRSCYCGCKWKMKTFNPSFADLDADTLNNASYNIY